MPQIEIVPIAKAKAAAPGWAYVPVTETTDLSKTPLIQTSTSRTGQTKRAAARTAADVIAGAHSKSQVTKIRLRLDELARDNPGKHDVSIPEALKREINEGKWKDRKAGAKLVTTNVRRILGSEKTWAHHVADVAAELEAQGDQTERRKKRETIQLDVEMADVNTDMEEQNIEDDMTEEGKLLFKTHVPQMPSKAELNRLLQAPPLSYAHAAAGEPASNTPLRRFCEMCSYWGKMKCILCGSYVCSLVCKQTHDAAEHPHR